MSTTMHTQLRSYVGATTRLYHSHKTVSTGVLRFNSKSMHSYTASPNTSIRLNTSLNASQRPLHSTTAVMATNDGDVAAVLTSDDDISCSDKGSPSSKKGESGDNSIGSREEPVVKKAAVKTKRVRAEDRPMLKAAFVKSYKDQKAPFGFNGLGELVYRRTYARVKDDGFNEEWYETVERVVEGTFKLQKKWMTERRLGWQHPRGRAEEMYKRIFEMKFLPPGRGLWAMGSPLTEERGLYAALNNCAFVSTADIQDSQTNVSAPFKFLMDAAMLGVGVGFDTLGAEPGNAKRSRAPVVKGPSDRRKAMMVEIEDTREAWVDSVALLIDSYFDGSARLEFDYSKIRPAGEPIKGFGGVSSGPRALEQLHNSIRESLDAGVGDHVTITQIVDIMNMIGRCVVAGNVRRAAEISFGDPKSAEYVDLKNYEVNPQREAYGWASNNSVFAELGMDYTSVCERVQINGEPGFAWLDNMRQYSRMDGPADNKDHKAMGGNPCLEQTLESYELCCLVETFPHKHENLEDFLQTLEYAYLYAKTVTLGETHWPESNRVMLRNRRIGCSVSGIAQFISDRGVHTLKEWLEAGYHKIQELDIEYSDEFAVPRSIKTTSVKPSGTVSLLAGATPGLHYPHSRYQIRRVRAAGDSELLGPLENAGYAVETDVYSSDTKVASFPVDVGKNVRPLSKVSMWEQLQLAAFMQRYWADNQVSCTITFDPETEGPHLKHALDFFQYQLKGISFLPRTPEGAYAQMPYEEITEAEYKRMMSNVKPIDFSKSKASVEPDKFCDGDSCTIALPQPLTEESYDAKKSYEG
ncbi:hypothetical protein SARC_04685 [Sphaeroforma arctica JP610]|uniref:ribonucleoside-triphosphate reductase (thioredoxin) n=1 Tax=Sphaeroforma arctica JP610 TaxID=667725 RepID=A0A0L0G1L6_9EUKA|nr:hypothetical protein SARC_04685 [Sphaeroforma arctica JP610]KNC83037.1 hypothetical protein SARC_04685 [Sphaeroforma arctica JP610]|eukprot:XP_014156939.1 hypothetical protein SARC_04685 [Sphaeroforma arctica JP610]